MTTTAPVVIDRVREVLREAGVPNEENEARWLLEAASGRSRSDLVLHPEVDDGVERDAVELAERRAAGEPLQYVTGIAGFRRLDLRVGPGVFVPRPETELVVEKAMELLPQGGTVIDVGTGSGAIALSIADERPDARVLATERFADAAEWARRNKDFTGKDVEIIESDLLDDVPSELRNTVDVIVSNPPYVPESDRATLPSEIVDREPHGALFGGRKGLDVIRRLAEDALGWIKPGGWLVLEMGAPQRDPIQELLETLRYEDIRIGVDYADWPRVASARKPR